MRVRVRYWLMVQVLPINTGLQLYHTTAIDMIKDELNGSIWGMRITFESNNSPIQRI